MKRHRVGKTKRRFTTQAQVEQAIRGFMGKAQRAEASRDRAKYESPEYWRRHDVAMKWHSKAEALMPRRGAS